MVLCERRGIKRLEYGSMDGVEVGVDQRLYHSRCAKNRWVRIGCCLCSIAGLVLLFLGFRPEDLGQKIDGIQVVALWTGTVGEEWIFHLLKVFANKSQIR